MVRPVRVPAALNEMLAAAAAHAYSRLASRELALGAKCKRHCDESRRFAAAGDVSGACGSIGAAYVIAGSAALSQEGGLLCTAEVLPAEAYIERTYENWRLARELVHRSMQVDQELEESCGYTVKSAHRIHMLTVLATLHFQQGDPFSGTRQIIEILLYITGESVAPSKTEHWEKDGLRRLPAGMQHVLALQAIEVFAAALSAYRGDVRERIIQTLLAALDPRVRRVFASPDASGQASIREYLGLFETALGDECAHLMRAMEMMERTQGKSLVSAIALDSALWCLERGASPEAASALVGVIRRQARGRISSFPLHGERPSRASSVETQQPGKFSA